MAHDPHLVERIRQALRPIARFDEKRMFGGVGFMVNGNMTVGVHKEYLIVRVGIENHESALKRNGARVFDITGKPMKGWVMVSYEGYSSDHDLAEWISAALEYAITLPPK